LFDNPKKFNYILRIPRISDEVRIVLATTAVGAAGLSG